MIKLDQATKCEVPNTYFIPTYAFLFNTTTNVYLQFFGKWIFKAQRTKVADMMIHPTNIDSYLVWMKGNCWNADFYKIYQINSPQTKFCMFNWPLNKREAFATITISHLIVTSNHCAHYSIKLSVLWEGSVRV